MSSYWKAFFVLLAQDAAFTKVVWFLNQRQSLYHSFSVQQIQAFEIEMSKSQVPQPILIFHLFLKDFLCYSCNSSSFLQIFPEFEGKHSIAGHMHLCNDLLTWRYVSDCTHIIFEERVVTFVQCSKDYISDQVHSIPLAQSSVLHFLLGY